MIIFQLMSVESRKQIPPNLRKLTIQRSSFKNVFRLSHIVEQELQSKLIESDLPCSNLTATAVLNSIHSQALIHAIEAWRMLSCKIIGRSG